MNFQNIMQGIITANQDVWIISGKSSVPHSVLARITDVQPRSLTTAGCRLDFITDNLFVMVGSTLFSLEGCRITKEKKQFKIIFDSAVLVYPKPAAGLEPTPLVPLPEFEKTPTLRELVEKSRSPHVNPVAIEHYQQEIERHYAETPAQEE
jgi:hypothetical protein